MSEQQPICSHGVEICAFDQEAYTNVDQQMDITKNHGQLSVECPQETKIHSHEKLTNTSDVASQREYLRLTLENYSDNNCLRDVGEFRSSYGKCE